YFPDRVVPMLPDALSGDLCSLHEGVDRACMALRVRLNSIGEKLDHEFHRGLMRSPASLNYQQAQAAADGTYDEMTEPLVGPINDLFAAYESAVKARNARQPLNLDLSEREIVLSDEGRVTSVAFKDRLEAHRLVEEFMILANVCAAETLEQKRKRLLYRVHEEPSPEKLEALREVAEGAGLKFPKGQVLKTVQLNRLLDAAAGTEDSETVSMTVLRSMTQAYYGPENLSHFGLNLKRYAHFTSPIRRYADLIVHRALIAAHGWGDDGISDDDMETLQATGDWISQTERRSMLAERDTNDRYLAAFLSERVGEEFTGRVSGIAKFGLFVKLDGSGADGMVPLSHLGSEYWVYSRENNSLTGDKSGRVIRVGDAAVVRLSDATPLTGGLTVELLEVAGKPLPKTASGRRAPAKKKRGKRKVVKSNRRG
ncbi:MAG: RNB domain-containing ribonuclease, partial [Pseudomonadota bacterium]